MTSDDQEHTPDSLVAGIDQGIEAHLAWNLKLLRCSFLRESPGDDMLRPNAHELCRFGLWFARVRSELERFDGPLVEQIADAHQNMHTAVRAMCVKVLEGRIALAEELSAYEHSQSDMVGLLRTLREGIADASIRRDELTGLPLRHSLEHAFEMRSKEALRRKQTLWMAMIDVDLSSAIASDSDHRAGDLVLRHVAQVLSGNLRDNDVLIHFGGDEFLGLFLVAESDSVTVVAQRLLDAIRAATLLTENGLAKNFTTTLGLACVRPEETLASAVDRADLALLQGNAIGRDRYVLAID